MYEGYKTATYLLTYLTCSQDPWNIYALRLVTGFKKSKNLTA